MRVTEIASPLVTSPMAWTCPSVASLQRFTVTPVAAGSGAFRAMAAGATALPFPATLHPISCIRIQNRCALKA